MEKYKMLGCAIRQAREEKGWTRHELADRIGTDTESVSRLEDGMDDISVSEAAGYIFLLNISPNIIMYEDDVEEVLLQDRMFRELQKLKSEQLDRLYESVRHIKRWRENHPGIATVEDYRKALENGFPLRFFFQFFLRFTA